MTEYVEREELSRLGKELADLKKRLEKALLMALDEDGLSQERHDVEQAIAARTVVDELVK